MSVNATDYDAHRNVTTFQSQILFKAMALKIALNNMESLKIKLVLFFKIGRCLLNPVGGQDLRQASKVGGVWVTAPERDQKTFRSGSSGGSLREHVPSGLTHPDLPPCRLVLCGMELQVALAPVSFSSTVKVSPCWKAFSSLGSSLLVVLLSGR